MKILEINNVYFSEKWGKKRGFKSALYTPPLNPPYNIKTKEGKTKDVN